MSFEKENFDNYQATLHFDDKTKQDAMDLFVQYTNKQDSIVVILPLISSISPSLKTRLT